VNPIIPDFTSIRIALRRNIAWRATRERATSDCFGH